MQFLWENDSATKFKDILRSPDLQMLMIRREYSENDIIPDKDVNTLLGKAESELTLPSTELKVLKYKNKKKLKKNCDHRLPHDIIQVCSCSVQYQ